ncbi:hypothetical protein DFS33DRAFT_1505760 [Desarmillaria ectypa]|nr:hypothetical protein DFS33DRAFT_1505760 [Desarmillaria ectypa]
MKLASLLFPFVSLFTVVLAVPVDLEKRDVFIPPVLYPHSGTVWTIKQRHNVTWDISIMPPYIINPTGSILLRKENKLTPVILAEGFDIRLGRIEVTVPWVIRGDDYSLLLYGDSGNWSENFTITGAIL